MRILISAFLILAFAPAFAGNKDSLKQEAEHAVSDPAKQAAIYCTLSLMEQRTNIPASLAYAQLAVAAAKKNPADKATLSRAYISLSTSTEKSGKNDEALALAHTAFQYAKQSGLYNIVFRAEYQVGNVYRRKADYNQALRYTYDALKIAEANHNDTFQGNACNSLGVIYLTIHDLDKAEQYHQKSLVFRTRIKDSVLMGRSYDNLGIVYRDRGEYDKALPYYFKSLAISIRRKDTANMAFLYNDIGAAYSKKGDVVNGEKYLKESIAIRERIGEQIEIAYTYNYLGENYEKKKDLKNAELYIKKALATAHSTQNTKQTYEALESLSDFYSRNGIYDSAYAYLKTRNILKDSIATMDNQKIIAELSTQYETEKKERKIREQEYALTQRMYVIIGISILVLVVMLISYFIYNRYKLKQRNKLQQAIIYQQDLATKAVIEAEEKERKRIAGDLHDGVGQLMSAARMNLSAMSSELDFPKQEQRIAFDKALALVDEGCTEVRSVSHNIMPNALLKTGLTSAIREFIDKIDARVLKVNLFTDGINERLPSNIETVLYRVIQECINNVIKHSGANHLNISIIKDKDDISVTIEDNGKGFNASDKSKFDGIGLKNIQTRVAYLKGTVEWDSAPGKGTVVSIHLPSY